MMHRLRDIHEGTQSSDVVKETKTLGYRYDWNINEAGKMIMRFSSLNFIIL
jgi:hypothetical protein